MSTATATCHCPRCTIERAGVSGPFTPAEFAALGLGQRVVTTSHDDDPVSTDPGVLAAQLAVREAREAYEPLQAAWLAAVAAHRTAETAPDQTVSECRGGLFSFGGQRRLRRTGELARQRKNAREEMELAWRKVVEANDRLRDATLAARVRVVEANVVSSVRRCQRFRQAGQVGLIRVGALDNPRRVLELGV